MPVVSHSLPVLPVPGPRISLVTPVAEDITRDVWGCSWCSGRRVARLASVIDRKCGFAAHLAS